jgi:tetratricopeptide (TPR) repeat protein
MSTVLSLVLAVALAGRVAAQEGHADAFERGIDAYRRGDWAAAEGHWKEALRGELAPDDRARVLHDLGNAAWRREAPLEAVGWYTAALRLEPRRADTWRNLELARAKAGLEPADRGDLRSTLGRLVSSLRPGERRALVLAALVPLALALGFEALRGGRLAARLSLAALALVVAASIPWGLSLRGGPAHPMLVVRGPTVPLLSEPNADLPPIGELAAGEEVERMDSLPGWTRVSTGSGTRGWVPEAAVFDLDP